MSEVTKADIGEVHKRIDKVVEHQNQTNIVLTRIETTLNLQPKLPARPCNFQADLRTDYDGHIKDHKETKQTWQKPIIRTVVDLIKMAVVAGVTWFFVRNK